MREAQEDRENRWEHYRASFAVAVRERGARQPDTDTIRDYFDQAIDCQLAVGHYIVDRYLANKAA